MTMGPCSREATERTFLFAGVAGITQVVFAAVRCSDSTNWAPRDLESFQTRR
jgi:hypothetical protein